MARKSDKYDWVDDPFNDRKNAELERKVRRSNTLGAVVFVVILVVVFLAFYTLFTFAGLYAAS